LEDPLERIDERQREEPSSPRRRHEEEQQPRAEAPYATRPVNDAPNDRALRELVRSAWAPSGLPGAVGM
jgi:hypothetical protein